MEATSWSGAGDEGRREGGKEPKRKEARGAQRKVGEPELVSEAYFSLPVLDSLHLSGRLANGFQWLSWFEEKQFIYVSRYYFRARDWGC